MAQHQRELRHAATRAFMDSLNQLQETLQPADSLQSTSKPDSSQARLTGSKAQFDLSSFEQAVADIEQFMTAREMTAKEGGHVEKQ